MIWVVCPMLRDTESFLRLRDEVVDHVGRNDHRVLRFLVVDDSAGTDDEVVQLKACSDVDLLTPPFNLGHQRAIVYGLRYLAPFVADDDVVVTMDSDGEDRPEDVPRLLQGLDDDHGTALVLAERTKRTEPIRFRLMYVMFRLFFRVLAGVTVQSGNFAAQRGDSLRVTVQHPSFDLCYSSTLLALRRPTAMVRCARGTRFAGRSRMNTSSLIVHGIRMLLPFGERIAARMLVMAAGSFIALVTVATLVWTSTIEGAAALASLVVAAVVFLTSSSGFLVLLSGFASSSAIPEAPGRPAAAS